MGLAQVWCHVGPFISTSSEQIRDWIRLRWYKKIFMGLQNSESQKSEMDKLVLYRLGQVGLGYVKLG